MKNRIAYWIFNYMPQWEAASKEAHTLMEHFAGAHETALYAFNMRKRRLGRHGRERHIPLPFGLPLFPLLGALSSSYDINHLFTSAGERLLLSRLRGRRRVLTVTKENASLAVIEKNIPLLRGLDAIVVECSRHRELLLQSGIPPQKLHLVYPGVEVQPYHGATGPFTILFASSPPGKNDLLNRGVLLMLQVARLLPEINFLFAWRETALSELKAMIRETGVNNVTVHNGKIDDMGSLYQKAHAVALPGLTHNSLKPCPHSGLESLAHGKPLLVSRPTSIAGVIQASGCGIVFEPTTLHMAAAVKELAANYGKYQQACHSAVKTHFSRQAFLESYTRIYDSLLQNTTTASA